MKKRLAVLVLAFAMVLTMGTAVFAAGTNSSSDNPSYAADEAKLVKYFKAPLGIDLPDEEFEFVFTPADPDEHEDGLGVPTGTEGFVETSTSIDLADMEFEDEDANQNKIGMVSIEDIFDGYNFTRAGEYTFTVAETDNGTDNLSYDGSTFKVRLLVNNDKAITDVTVQKGEDKVDPSDDDPTEAEDNTSDGPKGFTFKNVYTKTVSNHDEPEDPNPDPEDPDDPYDPENPPEIDNDPEDLVTDTNAFELDKFVLGEYGDQTKSFKFTVDVELPDDPDFIPADYDLAEHASAAADADGFISLAHEGVFTYDELPIGTKITVSEADATGYTKNWDTSGADNTSLEILIGEKGGYVICRNAFDDESVTPTGIIINNLPYVLLIGIALGGIVLFSRKRRYE